MHTHSHFLLKDQVWKSRAYMASWDTGHRCHCGQEITQCFSKVAIVPHLAPPFAHTWVCPGQAAFSILPS